MAVFCSWDRIGVRLKKHRLFRLDQHVARNTRKNEGSCSVNSIGRAFWAAIACKSRVKQGVQKCFSRNRFVVREQALQSRIKNMSYWIVQRESKPLMATDCYLETSISKSCFFGARKRLIGMAKRLKIFQSFCGKDVEKYNNFRTN